MSLLAPFAPLYRCTELYPHDIKEGRDKELLLFADGPRARACLDRLSVVPRAFDSPVMLFWWKDMMSLSLSGTAVQQDTGVRSGGSKTDQIQKTAFRIDLVHSGTVHTTDLVHEDYVEAFDVC